MKPHSESNFGRLGSFFSCLQEKTKKRQREENHYFFRKLKNVLVYKIRERGKILRLHSLNSDKVATYLNSFLNHNSSPSPTLMRIKSEDMKGKLKLKLIQRPIQGKALSEQQSTKAYQLVEQKKTIHTTDPKKNDYFYKKNYQKQEKQKKVEKSEHASWKKPTKQCLLELQRNKSRQDIALKESRINNLLLRKSHKHGLWSNLSG